MPIIKALLYLSFLPRYLYWYLKKQKEDNEKLLEVLRDLIKLDVTSELAFDYIDLLKEKGKSLSSALKYKTAP